MRLQVFVVENRRRLGVRVVVCLRRSPTPNLGDYVTGLDMKPGEIGVDLDITNPTSRSTGPRRVSSPRDPNRVFW